VLIFEKFGVFISRFQGYLIRRILKLNGLGSRDTVKLLGGEYSASLHFEVIRKWPGGEVVKNNFARGLGTENMIFQDRHLIFAEKIFADTLTGVLFTQSRRIIEESSAWPKDFLRASGFPRPRILVSPIQNSSNSKIIPSSGFYHWLIEDLPSFITALEYDGISKILVYRETPSYVLDFLSGLGKEFLFVPRYVSVDSTVFLSKGSSSGWPDKRDIEILRNYFKPLIQKRIPEKKIYISRRFSSRSPEFEEALEDALKSKGWQILFAERIKLEDQISIFSTAEVICGVGGAGLTSIIWTETGTKMIELSPEWYSPCFSRLCAAIEMDYECIFFEEPKLDLDSILNKIDEAVKNKKAQI